MVSNEQGNKRPSLKSASGAGFTFEDKVAAVLLSEMLVGIRSLGKECGIIEKLERQAGDWEPFGDLLIEVPNSAGIIVRCGGSVKSNRQIKQTGCDPELCEGMWKSLQAAVFQSDADFLFLACAPLPNEVNDHFNSLCNQARSLPPERLDQKVVHQRVRNIYDSFRNPGNSTPDGLPGIVLARLLHRQFDFESTTSRSEAEALKLCRDALRSDEQNEETANDLWRRLCEIAEELRVSGGAINREEMAARLRNKFRLRDDTQDTSAWAKIRDFSREGIDQVEVSLPGGLKLPRKVECAALRKALADFRGCHVRGDSGSGKSAIIKGYAAEIAETDGEVLWIRADRFSVLESAVSNLSDVLVRCRRTSALLVIDAVDGCGTPESISRIGRLIATLAGKPNSPWSVIVSCQTHDWSRACFSLIKHLANHPVVTHGVECGLLSKEDFELVCASSQAVARLKHDPNLRRILSTPKMLDVLLSGQLAENREIAGEADLVEWWWETQVRGTAAIAAEERVACELAGRMADELRSELPPDAVAGAEAAASALIRNRVLKRTRDGLLRFDHDLLADWSRVMHLRAQGNRKLEFIKAHTENPPWLRAVRLLSQHFLDRTADIIQWRDFLNAINANDGNDDEMSAESLPIIDAWIEGIIFSVNSGRILTEITDDLFARDGWLIRRLIRRLMIVGTVPDFVMQDRLEKMDAKMAEAVARVCRLPMWNLWSPLVGFLTLHPDRVTAAVPVELGEIAEMWGRMEDYTGSKLKWPELAELVVLNAEKELRGEVAGIYRHESGLHSSNGNKLRKAIYGGALFAAAQCPLRVTQLLLKAAGIAPWDDGDLSPEAADTWRGEWKERSSFLGFGRSRVESPVTSWPGGPKRKTSRDFFYAWFESTASIRVYRHSPTNACDATLAFLLDWPKRILAEGAHGLDADRFGFTFEADHMYPTFYTKGPFLYLLRESWEPALSLIVRLTNFATERYADWWPYDDKPQEIVFTTELGKTSWTGNRQIYGWFRDHANTAQVVTCALMALEKWLEECIAKGESITSQIQALYKDGRSLAFAGLLIALGKRHPDLFLNDLKPLLFNRQFYMFDMQVVGEFGGGGYWPRDGEFVNNLRKEWNNLPGRRRGLLEFASEWFVTRPEFQPVLSKVATAWREKAEALSDDSDERLPLLRWAATFDMANWKGITLPNGAEGWQYEQPEKLRDIQGASAQNLKQSLLTLPYQCADLIDKRHALTHEQLAGIWNQLRDWSAFEHVSSEFDDGDEFGSSLRDHRHARAGLIAVLLCLGREWIDGDSTRRPWLESEVQKLLESPPKTRCFGADDFHDDCEVFLARSVVQFWAQAPDDPNWRWVVATFVTGYRYRTIQRSFEEAFRERSRLSKGFRELEGLLLSFAVVRKRADIDGRNPKPALIEKWRKQWIPKFAVGSGPKWTESWTTIELKKPFFSSYVPYEFGRKRRDRRDYGIDIDVLLAAYGSLPPLAEATDDAERKHWLCICEEMLGAYLRTLPLEGAESDEEWEYQIWKSDQKITDIVAFRLFECSLDEQRSLWNPVLNLPPVAHHHITAFLGDVLIESVRTEPPRVATLLSLWRAMIQHLFTVPVWAETLNRHENKVWQELFLYGSVGASFKEKDYAPLVFGLKDLFERHVRAIGQDAYDQSALAALLVSDAGEQLLVNALAWLNPHWQKASSYFWKTVKEQGNFDSLLRIAWKNHFAEIRKKPEALKAFKTLTLNLAALEVSSAIEIQRQVGSE